MNLTWDETELQAVQADVEGFDIADFGVSADQLPGNPFDVKEPTKGEMKETEKLSEVKFVDVYYTPENKPDITLRDCIDTELYEKKMAFVESLDLPKEMKETMRLLAYRFIKIDFESVANYYAFNATEEEKAAILRLRCVLVDGAIDGFIEDRMLRVIQTLDDKQEESTDD